MFVARKPLEECKAIHDELGAAAEPSKLEQAVRDETLAIAEAVHLLKRFASKEVMDELAIIALETEEGTPAKKAMQAEQTGRV